MNQIANGSPAPSAANAAKVGRPVTTPKQLAATRITKLREHAQKTRERLRGFGLDGALGELVENIGLIETAVAQLPAEFKPQRSSRQGPQVKDGESFKLKPDAVKKYYGTQEAPCDAFTILRIVDSKQVLARFEDGTKVVVQRADIGEKIGG